MSRRARLPVLALAFIIAIAGPGPAPAADETQDQKVKRLEQEVEVLKQKVEILGKALAELRARLDVPAQQPGVTGPAPLAESAPPATRPLTATAATLPFPTAPTVASEEEKEPKVPTYATFQQLLTALPADLKPDPRIGWDAATADKARQWFKENVVGHVVKTRLALDARELGDIVRRPADGPGRAGDEKTFYRLDLTFSPQRFTYRGMLCEGRVLGEDGRAVSITVDEAFARRTSLLQPGQLITIEGKIKAVEMPQAGSIRTTMNVLLTDYTVLSFKR